MGRGVIPDLPTHLQVVGRITRKHGFNGLLKAIPSDDYDALPIQEKEFLFVGFDGKGVPFFVESWDKESGILQLEKVSSESEAAALEGRNIMLPADEIVDEESDMQGFVVEDETYGALGALTRIDAYPGQDMLVVWTESGELLIPAPLVSEVDEVARIIRTSLPEGYLDMNN
jgi:ribosomal 30S subunit maturation factor RimM